MQDYYRFEIPGLAAFAPVWRFQKAAGDTVQWSRDRLMQDMIFSLGMVELVSYWKIACPPRVIVEAGFLDQDQMEWWKNLYYNGLGEFFYVNQIWEAGQDDFMEIVCNVQSQPELQCQPEPQSQPEPYGSRPLQAPGSRSPQEKGVLVPIGGGKDSAVTLELLRGAGVPIHAYIINPRGATIHTTEAAGLKEGQVLNARRTLDPNMLELNRQGYLNGHTPFSALVAFSSIIAARMHGLPRWPFPMNPAPTKARSREARSTTNTPRALNSKRIFMNTRTVTCREAPVISACCAH